MEVEEEVKLVERVWRFGIFERVWRDYLVVGTLGWKVWSERKEWRCST